jgi:prepilin-type N-terminal cleavage/methylation domain-containing protein
MRVKGTGVRGKGKKLQEKTGFTLLEVMIALAIIGIALTVILHTVNYHVDVMQENTLTTMMYQTAKEKMYDLKKTLINSKGAVESTELTYENLVFKSNDFNIIELKTVVRGQNNEVSLNAFVIKKEGPGLN